MCFYVCNKLVFLYLYWFYENKVSPVAFRSHVRNRFFVHYIEIFWCKPFKKYNIKKCHPIESTKYCVKRAARPNKRKTPNPHEIQKNKEKEFASISAKKLSNSNFNVCLNPLVDYCILSFFSIFGHLSEVLECKKCHGDIHFLKSGEVGIGFMLHVKSNCSDNSYPSSPKTVNVYEIKINNFVKLIIIL